MLVLKLHRYTSIPILANDILADELFGVSGVGGGGVCFGATPLIVLFHKMVYVKAFAAAAPAPAVEESDEDDDDIEPEELGCTNLFLVLS